MKQGMICIYKKGSVSIETAISFSVVIIFVTALISITSFLRTDILMQRAVNQTCEDFAHFTPFSVTAADSVSTLVNALPEDYDFSDVYSLSSVFVGTDILSSGELRSSILDLSLGNSFANDILAEYIEYNGSNFFAPETVEVDFEIKETYIEVYVTYEVRTIVGLIQRQIVGVIPFYGEFDLFLHASDSTDESSDTIWKTDNFTRGIYFEEQYGANLPHTFPTINYYEDGEVGLITSMDLNRSTYSTSSSITSRMMEQIDRISSFNGASANINGSRYQVDGNSITSRRVTFVIPEDSPENLVSVANTMVSYGMSHGVDVVIVQDGCSGI